MKFFWVFLLTTGCNAAIPAQATTNQRALDVGFQITLSQAGQLTVCIQEDFYNQVPENQTASDFEKKCLTTVLGSKALQLASIYTSCDNCLKGQKSNFSVASKIISGVFSPDWKSFYKNLMTNFTAQKKTKNNAHDTVLNNGFAMFNKKYTLSHMQDLCAKIKKNMTEPQMKCLITNVKPLLDITNYACAAFLKSGLIG